MKVGSNQNKQLKQLVVLGVILGAGYLAYRYFTRQKLLITLQFTRKLAQQIKHNMLIVSVNFTQNCRQTLQAAKREGPEKQVVLINFFTQKMSQVYQQKQKLILDKYNVSKQSYELSLKKYQGDGVINEIQRQMIEAMQSSVRGELPNLSTDKRISNLFGKDQVQKLYQEASKMVLIKIMQKLQKQQNENPHIDITLDANFKKAIRDLNVYQSRIQFYNSKGFNQQWGCPNQNFYKLSQDYKSRDPQFKQRMKSLQAIFDQTLNKITYHPFDFTVQKINSIFDDQNQQKTKQLLKSAVFAHEKEDQKLYITNKSTRSQPEYNKKINSKGQQELSEQFYNQNESQ